MHGPPTKFPLASSDNQMTEAFRNLQQCVQHCQKAVFFTDGAGLLQRVNPAFEKLTGYTSAESVGKDLSWITAEGPTCKTYRELWKCAAKTGSAFRWIWQRFQCATKAGKSSAWSVLDGISDKIRNENLS